MVEDDGLIAYSLSAELRKAGFEVAGIAASGEEALQQIELVRPQLILIDIHLRGQMDGIELAERVRAQFETPVIYVTALSDADTLRRAKTTDPFAYLAKPVDADALYASIGTALRKHRAQGDLRKLRNYLATVLAEIETGVILTDERGAVQFLNLYAERVTGWGLALAQGRCVGSVLPLLEGGSIKCFETLITDVLEKGTPESYPVGLHSRGRDGRRFPLGVEVTPSKDPRGVFAAVITFQTASDSLGNTQPAGNDRLLLAIGRMAAGLAHDINNILTIILGAAEMALHTTPSQGSSPVHEIIHAAETAADITHKFLGFSSKRPSKPQLVNWNAIIRDHDRFYRHLLGPGVSWSVRLEPQLGLVLADPTALTEVLLDLVTSSRDSMPNGGDIILRTTNVPADSRIHPNSSAAEYVSFAVHGSGTGMDADTAQRAFEPFFSEKDKAECTQLVSPLVLGLVHELGGFVDVESRIGSGTTLTVCLPRASAAAKAVPPALQSHSGRRLVVVDDDPAVRRVLVSILVADGHRVIAAENGREALELVNKHEEPVDLLITDLVMPGLSGPELSAAIRVSQPGVKTLFVTGFPGDLLKGSNASDEKCVLSKPFSRTGLLRKVNALLESAGDRFTTTL